MANATTGAVVESLESRKLLAATLVDADLHRPPLVALVDADLHRPPRISADLNGDKKADVAVAINLPAVRRGGPTVVIGIFNNDGDGTLSPSKLLVIDTKGLADAAIGAVAVGDVNGDGTPDVVYKLFSITAEVQPVGVAAPVETSVGILLGDGKGGFTPDVAGRHAINTKGTGASGRAAGEAVGGIAVGDLNGDGLVDVITWGNGGVSVLPGTGKGKFADALTTTNPLYQGGGTGGQNPLFDVRTSGIGDLNGDGKADLIGTDGTHVLVATLASTAPLTFKLAPADAVPQPSVYVVRLIVGDLNGDGLPDLAALSNGKYQVAINAGKSTDGTKIPIRWSAPEVLRAGAANVWAGDVDGDGSVDLFTILLKGNKDALDTLLNVIR